MAFVKYAIHNRVIVHGSQVVIDMIEIKPHSGSRAVDFFFGCASAEAHDGPAVLLPHCTLRIEKVTDIIHTNNVDHFDQTGFSVHFDFDKVGLPGHNKRLIVPLSEHWHHYLIAGIGMGDERFTIHETAADLS